jgi:hypothetical protein
MKRALLIAVTLLVLGTVQADSGTSAMTVAAAKLNDGPYSDANTLSTVPVNTGLTILARQGGWYHVRLGSGQMGWVPMTNLRLNAAGGGGSNAPASAGGSSFFSLFESGRSGAGGTTATTGVRGLNTGDIANAQPDPAAVALLDQWIQKPDAAKSYAAALPLTAVKVDNLPEKKP